MALSPYQQLEQEFRRLHAFRGAASLLRWDAAVMMPRGSANVRGEQLAALASECHALLTSPKVSRLIERALANQAQLEDWQLANLREMRRERDHAIATPPTLVARLARAIARAEAKWLEAREQGDFKVLAPHLAEVVELTRSRATMRFRWTCSWSIASCAAARRSTSVNWSSSVESVRALVEALPPEMISVTRSK